MKLIYILLIITNLFNFKYNIFEVKKPDVRFSQKSYWNYLNFFKNSNIEVVDVKILDYIKEILENKDFLEPYYNLMVNDYDKDIPFLKNLIYDNIEIFNNLLLSSILSSFVNFMSVLNDDEKLKIFLGYIKLYEKDYSHFDLSKENSIQSINRKIDLIMKKNKDKIDILLLENYKNLNQIDHDGITEVFNLVNFFEFYEQKINKLKLISKFLEKYDSKSIKIYLPIISFLIVFSFLIYRK